MRATLRAALFDLDGTLIETEEQYTRFWQGAARRYRPDVPDLAQRIKGTTLTQILDTYFPDPATRQSLRQELDEWEAQMSYSLYPGAEQFLRSLRAKGVLTALVTSSDLGKMSLVYRKTPALRPLFDCVLTSEDFIASKPDPDCYLQAARRLGCERGECVVFEDAVTGLKAGLGAGIFTVGMTTTNPQSLVAPLCHLTLASFEGLTLEHLLSLWHPLDNS
ncbi:MAG: HAD family phosphatase [Prevotellaceae bacterium]|nr:HAD family phosphatase [Prevotellaceae bacterium]